jgi:hypothetical protein
MAQLRWADPYPNFQSEATEKRASPTFTKVQFKPGAECEIYLAGILAMTGINTISSDRLR